MTAELLADQFISNCEEMRECLEDAQRLVWAFHKFRNSDENTDWEKYEGTPLGEMLDCCMDLECSMGMENDDERPEDQAV